MGCTRRRVLSTVGGVGVLGVTGCLDGGETGNDARFVAQVSFPVIHDFASEVVPDDAEANSLVPVGQHGHGWEPSPDVQRNVATSDAFVYVFDGFQPWANDMASNMRRDHPEVALVEAGKDVDILETGGRGSEDSNLDPHFWLDPLRAKTSVGNIAERLGSADTEGEGYGANADAYKSRLDDLHEEFESSLADRSKNTVLVAGHNAFRYLSDRYGFDIETLTGLSPDEQPSAQDIERAQDLIDEEGIEYILSPVFESDTAAQSLVSDTAAEEVLPITSFASFRQDWLDDGWGYIEVMRNINLSSLERGLGA